MMKRCPWCLINEMEIKYHDEEWGVPVHDDRKQFEYLMLEVMQCGLSWDTVLKKREVFRKCFDNFDFDIIAEYSEQDIERIMDTPGVIRSRRKIEAVIGNALAYFSPWDNVVMFYGPQSKYPGLYILGEAVEGADIIRNLSGKIEITKVI